MLRGVLRPLVSPCYHTLLLWSNPTRPVMTSPRQHHESSNEQKRFGDETNSSQGRPWDRNTPLKIISWNVDYTRPEPATRMAAILDYLRVRFNKQSDRLIILLQEVCQASLKQLLNTEWVQRNFAINGLKSPTNIESVL